MRHGFVNDYSEGAHPRVLEHLARGNFDQEPGYGADSRCARAAEMLRAEAACPDAEVHFLSGGTQANLVVLASMLRPYESVVAVDSAHIGVHETGAIEATGHKVHALPGADGKLDPAGVARLLDEHADEHMVRPAAVFVSQSTELGTVYTLGELSALSALCRERGVYLYLDGARLGVGLACAQARMTMADVARLVDAFYVGGTKNGALLGEAVVLVNPCLRERFRFHMKQRGALLAKGRVLGAQFEALFEDGLWYELARHANAMAGRLAGGLAGLGVEFLAPPATNQIFPLLEERAVAALEREFGFMVWGPRDDGRRVVRLVTSWRTSPEAVDAFLEAFGRAV
jgi:threonine aldolase